jgi:hypothetical protein
MSYNVDQPKKNTMRLQRLFVAAFALGCAFVLATGAQAQSAGVQSVPE